MAEAVGTTTAARVGVPITRPATRDSRHFTAPLVNPDT